MWWVFQITLKRPMPLWHKPDKLWIFLWYIYRCFYEGDDSGKIIIWNMAPVKNEEDEKDENIPKVLCEMDNHLGK